MGEPHQRIWIEAGDECPYFYEESELTEAGSPVTEYIRADLCHRPAPAATDTGLVTVAKQWKVTAKNWSGLKPETSEPFDERELVTRSQAEELLAAERAARDKIILRQAKAIEKLEADNAALIHDLNRIKDHETELVNDNTALTARIKELEGINANLMGDDEDKPRYTTKRLKHEIARATEVLEAKLAAAEKALEGLREKGRKVLDVLKAWEDDSDLVNSGKIVADFRAVLGGKPSC